MSRGRLQSLVAIVLLVALDQWSKGAIFSWLEPPPPDLAVDRHGHRRYLILGEWLAFMTTSNKGAAFGQFGQFPHVLVGGRILAVGLLTWLLIKGSRHQLQVKGSNLPLPAPKSQRLISIAMTLVLAGAIGNLIDNLWTGAFEPDHPYLGVRDFLDVWFLPLGWDYHFPSFNVADACISVGAVLWICSGLFHSDKEPAADAAPEEASGGAS